MTKKCIALVLLVLLNGCQPKAAIDYSDEQEAPTTPTTEPTPTPFVSYQPAQIHPQEVYTVAMLGDSMMEALGPHGGSMTEKLNSLYGERDVLVDNYAVGSTNVLSLEKRLNEETQVREWVFAPLLDRADVDLVIVGSFAYNPLSHITERSEALRVQNEELTKLMTEISNKMPNTRVVFLATIAPNVDAFLKKTISDPVERRIQAEERMEYLENHIEFARAHNIPLVNVYEQSRDELGNGKLEYINSDDFLHPSGTGVELIAQTVADYIWNNKILPE